MFQFIDFNEAFYMRITNLVFLVLVSGCIGPILLVAAIYLYRKKLIRCQTLFKKIIPTKFLSLPNAWFARTIYLVGFILSVAILKHVDVSWEHYNKSGYIVVAYWVSRFILSIYLFVLFYTAGKLFLRLFVRSSKTDFQDVDVYEQFIISVFCGAFLYGLLFIVAGGLGMLHFSLALGVSVPIIFFAPKIVGEGLSSFISQINDYLLQKNRLSLIMSLLMCWFLLIICLSLFISKVVYPASLNTDVWEHYLPYYRLVLNSGSTTPNELWYQFYLSKGAGLFFYVGLLSDCFAPQLVSWVFLLMTSLILFHILMSTVANIQWALLGSILFLGLYDGDFIKHHTVVTGCIAFLFWSAIQLLDSKTPKNSNIILTGAVLCSVYLGIYQPSQAVLVFAMLVFFIIFIAFFPSTRQSILKLLLILFMMLISIIIILIVNYSATGLIFDVPINFFWKYANHEKFLNLFGPSGVLYFLVTNNDLSQMKLNVLWLFHVFRFTKEFGFLFFYGFIIILMSWFVGKFKIGVGIYENRNKTLLILGYYSFLSVIFIFPAIILCQLFQIESINRIFSFSIFFTSLLFILLLRIFLLLFRPRISIIWFNGIFTVTVTVFILVFTFLSISQNRWNAFPYYMHYMFGDMSFRDVLLETDPYFDRSIKFEVWDKIRQQIGPEKYIYALGYNPAPGYSFPGVGAISEPSYALGVDYRQIIFSHPAKAKEILQKMQINYFIVDLQSQIFSGMAFSRLFNVSNINSYFQVFLQEDETFLLTWRQPGNNESIPLRLRQIIELKQNLSIWYPYTKDFDHWLRTKVDAKFNSINNSGSVNIMDSLSDLPDEIVIALRSNMEEKVFLSENQVLFNKLITDIYNRLKNQSYSTYMINWHNLEKDQQIGDVLFSTITEAIVKNVHNIVRATFMEGYISSWGERAASALLRDASGNPYRQIYQDPHTVAVSGDNFLMKSEKGGRVEN